MKTAPSLLLIALGLNCLVASFAQAQQQTPPAKEVAKGVLFTEIPAEGKRPKLWIYTPNPLPAKPVPAIFIAPAGTAGIHGIGLLEGDEAEHIPYAAAGFVVVAYDLSGALTDVSNEEMKAGFEKFFAARAGAGDLAAALDYAASIKAIDSTKVIVAGHSSAGSVSLVAAALEPRVKACISYAPVTDLAAQLGKSVKLEKLEVTFPGVTKFCAAYSPHVLASKIKVPTFLFVAEDDSLVPHSEVKAFSESIKLQNPNVTLKIVKQGEHYDSMIQEGIPAALVWLKSLPL